MGLLPPPPKRLSSKVKIVRIYHILFFPLSPKFFSFLDYTVLDHVIIQGREKNVCFWFTIFHIKMCWGLLTVLTLPSWLRRKPTYKHMQEKNHKKPSRQTPRRGQWMNLTLRQAFRMGKHHLPRLLPWRWPANPLARWLFNKRQLSKQNRAVGPSFFFFFDNVINITWPQTPEIT